MTRFLGGGVVTARWDECYELVGAAGYSGEGSPTGCLLAMFSPQACTLVTSMGTQGNSALSFFLKKKTFAGKCCVGCRCFVSLIHRGQLEFCQHE